MTAQPATIQVKYVNQPKQPGWKFGSVKDANDQLFNVATGHLGYFAQGETCEILWEQTGKYPTIIGKGGQLFPKQPSQPAPGSAVPPRNANWPGPATFHPDAPPQEFKRGQPSDKEEGMFIMGVVGRAMGSGKFEIEQIPELTRVAATAWKGRHETPVLVPESPGHQSRNPDSQYGGDHPDGPPMDDPRFQ